MILNIRFISKITKIIILTNIITSSNYKLLCFDDIKELELYTKINAADYIDNLNNFKQIKKIYLDFENILEQVLLKRYLKGYYNEFITKITPIPGSIFIILGSLNGAFYSLSRILKFLNQRNIIDNNFKIKRNNIFFIFMGNIFNGYSNIIDTFLLILKLMYINPDSIFYLKGDSEINNNWLSIEFKNELEKKIINYNRKTNKNILIQKIEAFLNTLPNTLYLVSNINNDSILISNSENFYSNLNMENYQDFLKSLKFDIIQKHNIENKLNTNFNIQYNYYNNIKAIIKSYDLYPNKEYFKGLYTLYQEKGAIVYNVFSSPTLFYQKYFGATHDSFSVINTAESLKDYTVSLYNRDINNIYDFSKKKTYKLTSSQKVSSPDILYLNQYKNNRFNNNEIKIIKESIKNIFLELKDINQEMHNFENKLNNFLTKNKNYTISIKTIREIENEI